MREARQRRVPQIRRAGAVWRNGALGPIREMRVMVQGDVSLGEGSCAVAWVRTEIQEVKLRRVLLWRSEGGVGIPTWGGGEAMRRGGRKGGEGGLGGLSGASHRN